jgi:hypothetical protein
MTLKNMARLSWAAAVYPRIRFIIIARIAAQNLTTARAAIKYKNNDSFKRGGADMKKDDEKELRKLQKGYKRFRKTQMRAEHEELERLVKKEEEEQRLCRENEREAYEKQESAISVIESAEQLRRKIELIKEPERYYIYREHGGKDRLRFPGDTEALDKERAADKELDKELERIFGRLIFPNREPIPFERKDEFWEKLDPSPVAEKVKARLKDCGLETALMKERKKRFIECGTPFLGTGIPWPMEYNLVSEPVYTAPSEITEDNGRLIYTAVLWAFTTPVGYIRFADGSWRIKMFDGCDKAQIIGARILTEIGRLEEEKVKRRKAWIRGILEEPPIDDDALQKRMREIEEEVDAKKQELADLKSKTGEEQK